MKTRRQFLSKCTLSLAALAVVPASSIVAATKTEVAATCLSHAVWSQQINSIFQVRLADGQTAKLTLLKAPLAPLRRAMGNQVPLDLNHEKFSLIFSSPKDVALDSAIHTMEHSQLGRLEMHLGEFGQPNATERRYEAVFNQPAASTSRIA